MSLYAQLEGEDAYRVRYYANESAGKPLAEHAVPYSRSEPIASASSLGLLGGPASFKGWKMRRESDGRWYAQDKAGAKRYVGLVDGKLPDGYDFCLLKDGARLLKAAPAGSGVSLYAQLE